MPRSTAFKNLLDRLADVIRLEPQIVGRFYGDGNRLRQRGAAAPTPAYFKPERWIGSSTRAVNPPTIPSGGLSRCEGLTPGGEKNSLRDLLADAEVGPRLLGEKRHAKHSGEFRVLLKILDALHPIPLHVHADDAFVQSKRSVYPAERFGKDEAYYFLERPKGLCPYTHVGVYPGVGVRELLAARKRGTDHLLELTRPAYQEYHHGMLVRAGLLHRPGTALTLEIQQPSDVYTMIQTDFGGVPLHPAALHPGFKSIEAAAERVVNWKMNLRPNIVEECTLKPVPVQGSLSRGGRAEWIYPPDTCKKFSGMRLGVDTRMTLRFDSPFLLFVWEGRGTFYGRRIDGGRGAAGHHDEFFVGDAASRRGVEIVNKGDRSLTAFVIFAAPV